MKLIVTDCKARQLIFKKLELNETIEEDNHLSFLDKSKCNIDTIKYVYFASNSILLRNNPKIPSCIFPVIS